MSIKKLISVVALVVLAYLAFQGVSWLLAGDSYEVEPLPDASQAVVEDNQPIADSPDEIGEFTGQEFMDIFVAASQPNSILIVEPPEITGDQEADAYIQQRAEKRGYFLQRVPSSSLNSYDGFFIQELAKENWDKLVTDVESAGHQIELVSSYRSVEEQRELFLQRLKQAGLTASNILSGAMDNELDGVLRYAAPPGYSRHHSGYVIDVGDPRSSVYEGSATQIWLARDNFATLKEYGFIPSYPEGATNQGPNPEAWEYVWVGRDNLRP